MYQIDDGPRSPGSNVEIVSELTISCESPTIIMLSAIINTSQVGAEVEYLRISVLSVYLSVLIDVA